VYTVEWLPAAEDELARIWNQPSRRPGVTAAQAHADQLLSRDPVGNGQHLSEGLYQISVPPLTLSYTIDELGQLVEVTWVRYDP
jgi:hypothetical protein